MPSEMVRFAVLLPKSITDLSLPASRDGNTIAKGEMREAVPSDQSLAFDLAALGELAWYTIQVLGPDAKAIAYGIVGNYLYDKLKQKIGNNPADLTLNIRLPSGRRVRFTTADEEIIKELKREFEEQTA